MTLFNVKKYYEQFNYPDSFVKILELNLLDYDFWYMMSNEQVETRITGLKKRYPKRKLIPFARRDDSDDIACFEEGQGARVFIVHDFASEGYEQRKIFENFWEWFKDAIQEMIDYNE